ncbi:MAG: histidine kinase, partial [Actinobacteria bacterium]|nr:histidine kinase [Actinomycetota bacterium]
MASTERIRLAQEIHDGIAQDLIGIGYSLDLMLAASETSAQTRITIRTLRFEVTDLIDKVRREMYQLRSPLGSTLS